MRSARTEAGQVEWRRVRWLAPLSLVVFVALLELIVFFIYPPLLQWPGRLVLALVNLVALTVAFTVIYQSVRRIQREVERRNEELIALQRANLDIYGELSLEVVLQRVVDQAAHLLTARYGALAIVGEDDRIEQFITAGVDEIEREKIGAPPSGSGLLGVSLHHGQCLRVDDLRSDERAAGFPEHHPVMRSLLAVPIVTNEPFHANLYVADKITGEAFTAEDEGTLERFAGQAALAIEKAVLHRQLSSMAVTEERLRIAREMHDGMAQVLAYVNTKAQAVREYLVLGKTDEASRQLEQLAEAARGVYNEVREGILGLRTTGGGGASLQEIMEGYLSRWREQTGIVVNAEIPPELAVSDNVELQLVRIIQEALSNVRKHAEVDHASVVVENPPGSLVAAVRDDGRGFDVDALNRHGLPRFGLAIMRERAESIGGTFLVESVPGSGTTVRVELPSS